MATQSFCGMLRKVLLLLETSSSNHRNCKLGRLLVSCARVHLTATSARHLPEDEKQHFIPRPQWDSLGACSTSSD